MGIQIDPSVRPAKLNIQTKESQTIQIECEYVYALKTSCA